MNRKIEFKNIKKKLNILKYYKFIFYFIFFIILTFLHMYLVPYEV